MNESNQAAFDDPALQRAASALLQGDTDGALMAAETVRNRINAPDRHGATLLKWAIRRNDERAVRGLLALGADANAPRDAAPIAAAVEMANTAIVKALLDGGADPNGATNGESALWRAALGDRREVADLLLQRGAQVDRGNRDGMTPALAAVKADHYTLALHLIQRGASPFAKSLNGTTLGEWARESRINPDSEEGRAREQLYAFLRRAKAM